jgi:hypothetical protein
MNWGIFSKLRTSIYLVLICCLVAPSISFSNFEPAGVPPPIDDPYESPDWVIFLPIVIQKKSIEAFPDPSVSEDSEWLKYLNFYRTMAQLPPVSENPLWSLGSWQHSLYMVMNDILAHGQDVSNPYYTPEGDLAAKSSNIAGSFDPFASDHYAIDAWMQAPFHAISILDPGLSRVGYGSFREEKPGLQMAATLDVLRGLGDIPSTVNYPITWPGDGATVPLNLHWGEFPSPLTSCPGYSVPTGLPVLLLLGPGKIIPRVSAHEFRQGSTSLEHCLFDETSYENPDPGERKLVKAVLAARNAIVLIPRQPLRSGLTYTVSITTNDETITWSFTVGEPAQK